MSARTRPPSSSARTPVLAFSALFAGFTIGATALAVALASGALGDASGATFVAALLYPIGYVAVILGRAQFFTENTLDPMLRVFESRRALRPTARLWAIVYLANLAGALAFALLVIEANVLGAADHASLVDVGADYAEDGFGANFWSAVIAGWLLATVAWLVEATETAIGQVFAIWALTVLVGLGTFDHCIASTVNVSSPCSMARSSWEGVWDGSGRSPSETSRAGC